MNPLEAVLLIVLVGLPFHLLVQRQFARLRDPRYLREHGVVIRREEILERPSVPIGAFGGHTIYESVTFMDIVYRFDRIAEPSYRERVRPREIFLEPGLIYVTDRSDPPAAPARSGSSTPAKRAESRAPPRIAPVR